jgi:hypothetical protein
MRAERAEPKFAGSEPRSGPLHPVVGDLELTFEVMTLVANPELTMFAFTAEPGSTSDEALNLLASGTATLDEAEASDLSGR